MTPNTASFADLLRSAVTDPGIVSGAYRQFHNYSIGNQLLAWAQCLARGIQPGPMATFPRWKELGRYVRKGEKAITLCQPVTVKRTTRDRRRRRRDRRLHAVHLPAALVRPGADRRRRAAADRRSPAWDAARALAALDVDRGAVRRDRRQRPGLRARAVDRHLAGQPAAAQDAVPRAGARAARPHDRGRAERRRADAAQSPRVRGRSRRAALLRGAGSARRRVLPRLHPDLVGRRQSDSRALGAAHPEGGRSDPEGRRADRRGGSHEGRHLRPRLDGRPGAGEPAAGAAAVRRGPRLDGRRVRRSRA